MEGLPAQHELFDAFGPSEVTVETLTSGRSILFFGRYNDWQRFGVDTATGAVVVVHESDNSVGHVNASVTTFARSLDAFTSSCPFGSREDEEHDTVAAAFRDRLREIDPTSLREDPGFWHQLLFDISIGDWVAEEFD
ncbi:hypothetical protein UK23_39650 [Lentzea aerocolonigenes]|uniref:SUKH-4 immunity protein n=1 Tax=Lentzea aerocolonigenes TaxID=68170 RepID=A0A0F0GKJ9_LENAE|nr:SUKH-4 family immunity protein [Lentzea aerocolonigenes]KJK41943.1 hypothetical protein UK23_39650 [Lentzea aerocolonigenes]